jgi:uncharacterized protein YukE
MAASDDVAALPGGQDLAAIAAEVSGNPAALRAIASAWAHAASGCEQQTTAVNRAAAAAGHDWKGSAEQEFEFVMSQFSASSRHEQECLRAGAKALDAAADALAEAQTTVEGICERLYTESNVMVREYEMGGGEGNVSAMTAQLTADATGQARTAAATAEHALSHASATLSKVLSDIKGGGAFSRLYVPTSKGFTPPVSVKSFGSGVPAPSSQIVAWISEAASVLEAHGTPASKINPEDIWIIIYHESSGNPKTVNTWDINAQEGHPSIGLMQVIQPTFNTNKLSGYDDIRNPVDNIIAGVRYALSTYHGSLSNVPGVVAVRNGQPYVGY